ncbi:hypothetical protein WBP07_28405 [Novosphingobium sp. BL-8A]|uniref:hypothetical protein n=1 Tax=Novosphingobium sp. BL-8A TaxID=3127639 RepID=UPI003757801E
MSYSSRFLRRRPRIERQVLAILRGEDDLLLTGSDAQAFAALRQLARSNGFVIHEPKTIYVGDHELALLSWLAAAQRISASHLRPKDRMLAANIRRCAMLLENAGLRLYPLTLYSRMLEHTGFVQAKLAHEVSALPTSRTP